MQVRPIAPIAILWFCLSLILPAEEVTKETLPDICPKLEIKTTVVNADCRGIEINIPADEVRFKRLFQAWFIIREEKGEIVLRVPVRIIEIDGVKRIHVDASPDLIKNAIIQLDFNAKDPTTSFLDTLTLVLPSLVGINKLPVEQDGNGQANAMTAQGALLDTAEKAKNAVVQAGAKYDPRVPLRAQDREKVGGLFRLGCTCGGLGKQGDRIWQVQFVDFSDQVVRLIWVNAENGNLRLVLPVEVSTTKAPNKVPEDTARKPADPQH
jgi:hypothetical protein